METASEAKQTCSDGVSGIVNGVVNGSCKAGGYMYDIVNSTFYFTGKCSGYILNMLKHFKISVFEKAGKTPLEHGSGTGWMAW